MKHRLLILLGVVACTLLSPLTALAEKKPVEIDVRLEGFQENVAMKEGSSAFIWLLMIVLSIVCVAVLFKNARRTHLD